METPNETPNLNGQAPPPYFAFRTLLNTLEDMKKRGIPNRIDRTFLTGMSGAGQTQFIAGLKSLGLIDAAGSVQDRLREMVSGTAEDRQRILGEVLKDRYAEAVELGTTNATTGELVEVFRHYGVSGDTARKAIAFYLNAAKFAGNVPVSPLFQTPKVSSSGSGPRRVRREKNETGTDGSSTGAGTGATGASTSTGLMADLHPALAGVLIELPRKGRGWTKERRDAFLKMFEMAIDFTIPVMTEPEEELAAEDAEEDETTL